MSKRKKFRLAVSLAAALVVLIPMIMRWQAQQQLSAYRKKLIASGEKLTVAELAPNRNLQATNTTRFLRIASSLALMGNFAPSAMRPIKPGVARVAWRQAACLEENPNANKPEIDVWPNLIGVVRTNEQTFVELQRLLVDGGMDLAQDYSQRDLSTLTYLPAGFSKWTGLGVAPPRHRRRNAGLRGRTKQPSQAQIAVRV